MNTQDIIAAVEAVQAAILANEQQIESLDRAIGDGDHFINVRRGCEAIAALKPELAPLPPSQAFNRIGMKLLSTIGGASGPLIASFFLSMGKELEGLTEPDAKSFAQALAAGVEAIKSRGKADLGEKTMLDVLIPAARLLVRLADEGSDLDTLCSRLKHEAELNMLATRDMIATKGRAHFLGERALGHIDPGAKTSQVALFAVCDMLTIGAAS
ncbi:dihydroxyacetone kinase subunit DhaL [Caenimonas soli]|jgi:dihydroxyacetone kinase-like protein|uniref:dihydroxyacetone kinase subunit DhaL n=1 Tax=Caenimonas soli TaxID=2735555 RepID=UPI0015531910|nr:dihydroxyacetone kinase subunit DhaL [Caenimonas soli]NPC57395.1 dihydroxyacetone kinase subunit L [Caenimonas soli]